jgi:ABC-type sugar transport system ATPase subunit
MISSELEEITEGADRVVVLREGRTVAEFDHDEVNQDTVMHAMAHGKDEAARRLQEDGETARRRDEATSARASASIGAMGSAALDEPDDSR